MMHVHTNIKFQGQCKCCYRMKALGSFETSGSTHPLIQCHLPEDLYPQIHRC